MSEDPLIRMSRELCRRVGALRFGPPVTHAYNPLRYARAPHEEYLRRFGQGAREVLLVGMNPGPWGMAQTGVPFGAVDRVRDWLGIEAEVRAPRGLHPRRPVLGFSCSRQEVSGNRLWGWAAERFGEPLRFFRRFFVWNYCPLVFYDEAGRNLTPDKLPAGDRTKLFRRCDEGLRELASLLEPRYVIGVGNFARDRAREALEGFPAVFGAVLHPSPASPAANRGWAARAEEQLAALGVRMP